MKLSKDYKYTVLCEDKLSHCFTRRFLIAQGVNGRKIIMTSLPAAGCGEQYVRQQFPRYLTALRSKSFDSNILVVIIDADAKSCAERRSQFDEMCLDSNVRVCTENDRLLIFIPRRNIETWVKYYSGESVDEETDYAHYLNGHESDCYPAADKMSEDFSKSEFSSTLTSLQFAYKEYTKLISLIRQ